jgi:transcriptional regulator with XRE-family HTH domain
MDEVKRRRGPLPQLARLDPFDVEIGARVAALRLSYGLTGRAFAELLGVDNKTARDWESGALPVKLGRLSQIAKALNVDPGWFFIGLQGDKPQFTETGALALLTNESARVMRGFLLLSPGHQQIIDDILRALLRTDEADELTPDRREKLRAAREAMEGADRRGRR